MKRMSIALVVGFVAWCAAAVAQEAPEKQLDYVRKLRLKGYHDLVEEYILLLEKVQPQLAGELGLERARSQVAVARLKNLDQRSSALSKARDIFQDFVKKFDGKPEAVQARVEMAKLVSYHGQALLTKALRDYEEPKDQHDAARKAEALFLQAGAELDVLIKQLQDKDQIRVKFERAVNIMDQARTYIDTEKEAVNRKRAELMSEAAKMFETMIADEGTEIGLMAHAWLIKCNLGMDQPIKAETHYKKVLGSAEKAPFPAQRLARYFYIAGIPKNVTIKQDKLKLIKDEANKWIKDYGPSTVNSWEGQGVRFELAEALLIEANSKYKDGLKNPAAAPVINQALKLYESIASLDGDFSEEAKRRTIMIAVNRLEKAELKDIRDFDNSLLKAHYEIYKVKESNRLLDDATAEAKKEADDAKRKKLEAKVKEHELGKKKHMSEAMRALAQALNLATSATSVQKVDEARLLLVQAHYGNGDLERAAVAAEALGRTRPPTKAAPRGIGVAFRAYDEIGQKDDNEALRQRIRELAEYVLSPESQKLWQNETITSIAHHRLAMQFKDKKQPMEAIKHLEKVADDSGFIVYAMGQLAFIGIAAAKDQDANWTEAERKEFKRKAREAIQRMPATLPLEIDSSTATMYFYARMEEAKFLYSEAAADMKAGTLAFGAAKYKDMNKWVNQHLEMFKKFPPKHFEEKTTNDLTTLMTVLDKYSRLGLADVDYRLGNYDKVLSFDLVGPLTQGLKEEAKKEGRIKVKDHVVTSEVVALVLRTYVQKRDLDNAKLYFDILQRLAPESGVEELDTTAVMFGMFKDVQEHLDLLEKSKDVAKYKDTLENYSKFYGSFLDSLVDQVSKKPRSEAREYIFLANAYMALKEPKKAAATFEKAPTPAVIKNMDEEMKKSVPSDEEVAKRKNQWIDEALVKHKDYKKEIVNAGDKERNEALRVNIAEEQVNERREYWYLQIQYGKALRDGKEYNQAYRTLDRVTKHPLGEYHIVAEMLKNEVLEDDGKFGAAIKGWQALMGRLGKAAANDKSGQIKKLYFDSYFSNARCWYRYSQSPKIQEAKKEDTPLNAAARYIVNLENAKNQEGWNLVSDRFQELLAAEPKLKAAYDRLKQASAPAGK